MLTLINKNDYRALRDFSVTMMWIFPLVFMLLLPWIFEHSIPWWPAALSALLGGLYLFYPKGLYVPYRIWMAIASVLGWVNTRIVLALAFYVLITPIGLLLRLFSKLQYQSRPKASSSFWQKSDQTKSKDTLKNPF
jgi:hypothetical protein